MSRCWYLLAFKNTKKNKKNQNLQKERSWGTKFEDLAIYLPINKSFQHLHKGGNFERKNTKKRKGKQPNPKPIKPIVPLPPAGLIFSPRVFFSWSQDKPRPTLCLFFSHRPNCSPPAWISSSPQPVDYPSLTKPHNLLVVPPSLSNPQPFLSSPLSHTLDRRELPFSSHSPQNHFSFSQPTHRFSQTREPSRSPSPSNAVHTVSHQRRPQTGFQQHPFSSSTPTGAITSSFARAAGLLQPAATTRSHHRPIQISTSRCPTTWSKGEDGKAARTDLRKKKVKQTRMESRGKQI